MKIDRDAVIKIINSDKVVIFSKTYCPFCTKAKKCFDQLKQSYTAIELDKKDDAEADEYQDILKEITGARSVPRVFISGKFIGGGDETEKLFKNGQLAKKLTEEC